MGQEQSRAEVVRGLHVLTDGLQLSIVAELRADLHSSQPFLALNEFRFVGWARGHRFVPRLGVEVEGGETLWEEEMRAAFAILAPSGVLDGLGLCAALALLSRGHLTDRVHELFAVYDVAGIERLGYDALCSTLRSGAHNCSQVCRIETCPDSAFVAMTRQAFRQNSRSRDESLSWPELDAWWTFDSTVRSWLARLDVQVPKPGPQADPLGSALSATGPERRDEPDGSEVGLPVREQLVHADYLSVPIEPPKPGGSRRPQRKEVEASPAESVVASVEASA